ncbi:hypothetical protein [Streptomyces sp. NPDC049585]|uniref:hypothetical protein n=1 Tax=Streptomyces sp. NPDC049585 TaxID=3155154 RepID=UPI003415FB75
MPVPVPVLQLVAAAEHDQIGGQAVVAGTSCLGAEALKASTFLARRLCEFASHRLTAVIDLVSR